MFYNIQNDVNSIEKLVAILIATETQMLHVSSGLFQFETKMDYKPPSNDVQSPKSM